MPQGTCSSSSSKRENTLPSAGLILPRELGPSDSHRENQSLLDWRVPLNEKPYLEQVVLYKSLALPGK